MSSIDLFRTVDINEGTKEEGEGTVRCGGLMVSVLDSGENGLDLSPGRGHRIVFLGKTLYSHSVSLHPGVY